MAFTIIAAATWPTTLERERILSWKPYFQNERGPTTLDGSYQTRNANGGGLWAASFGEVQIRNADQRKEWRALQITLRGGMTPVDVPVCAERPRQVGGVGTAVDIVADTAWAARATSGRIRRIDSMAVQAGQFFSIFDATIYGWRLHLIETAVPATIGKQDLTWWPPLRFAVADETALEFEDPRCVMQLASSDSMDLELTQRRFGDPSAEFLECGL